MKLQEPFSRRVLLPAFCGNAKLEVHESVDTFKILVLLGTRAAHQG